MMKLWQVVSGEQEMYIEAENMEGALAIGRKALEYVDGFDHSDEEFDAVAKVHDGPAIRAGDLASGH